MLTLPMTLQVDMATKTVAAIPHAETASVLAARAQLSDEALGLMQPAMTPAAYLDALELHQHYADACRLVAHWLPPREALWWGCLCCWYVQRPELAEKSAAALQAVVHAVQEPNVRHRQEAGKAADVAGDDTPAGCLARAVSYSDLGGPSDPPPPPSLSAQTVVAAILLAAAANSSHPKKETFHRFLRFGRELSRGQSLWA
jgi:hypothetical protein